MQLRQIWRILALVLTVVMLAGLMPAAVLAADASGMLSMSADKTEYRVGDTVTVTVSAKDAGTIMNGRLKVWFSTRLLGYTPGDTRKGTALADVSHLVWSLNELPDRLAKGEIVIAWAGDKAAAAGELLTMRFRAASVGTDVVKLLTGSYVNGGDNPVELSAQVNVVGLGRLTGAPTPSQSWLEYGQTLAVVGLSGQMTNDRGETVPGTFAWADPDLVPEPGKQNFPWIFTPDDSDYETVTGSLELTVKIRPKVVVTCDPKFYEAGHHLSETKLSWTTDPAVKGNVTWDDPSAEVKEDVAYDWTFTPEDPELYLPVKGSLPVWESHEHVFEDHETPPTCTVIGEVTHTCKICGYMTREVIPALGHNYVDGVCTRCQAQNPNWQEEEPEPEQKPHKHHWPAVPIEPPDTQKTCDGGADCPSRGFADLNLTGEDHEAMDYLVKNGLINGTSKTTMEPAMITTRAMIVTLLWRASGSPEVSGSLPFTDVPRDSWYWDAVAWAWANGLAKGTSDTTFQPTTVLNHEQLITFLYRYGAIRDLDLSARGDVSRYADGKNISSFANDSMAWAVGEGITGRDQTDLTPLKPVTRLDTARMLYRMMSLVEQDKEGGNK